MKILNEGRIPLLVTIIVFSVVALVIGKTSIPPNEEIWTSIAERSIEQAGPRLIVPTAYRTIRLDKMALSRLLATAPMEFTQATSLNPMVDLPMPDGTLARFRFEESPVVEPGLAEKYPGLKTYRAQGIDDPTATSRFDFLPNGFHAIIFTPSGTALIDPYAKSNTLDYISYWKKDATNEAKPFECRFDELDLPQRAKREGVTPDVSSGSQLRTYRLALSTTHEYTVAVDGPNSTIAHVLAAEVQIMNRVDGIYEKEVDVHFNLIANNNLITYASDALCGHGVPCTDGNDPFTYTSYRSLGDQNQALLTTLIGKDNYDIGHVLNTAGGGWDGGLVCDSGSKGTAQSGTGGSDPTGYYFTIDVLSHELGHAFGGFHTFNGQAGACVGGGYEVGSGITIMSYGGLCGQQNLGSVLDTIDMFFVKNLETMIDFSQNGNGQILPCGVVTSTGNTPPTTTGPGTFTIPRDTPFFVTASATDPDGDSITYTWEEIDPGAPAYEIPNSDADGHPRPLFRIYRPTPEGTRTFPSLPFILNNANVPPTTTNGFLTGELLPHITRTMRFEVVARDNRIVGGFSTAVATVNIAGGDTPFAVIFPNTPVQVQRLSKITVTWNASGNATQVNISLSTDGGNTFPIDLATNTPNDGSETVEIPDLSTNTARIKVSAVGNIYFDISDSDFTIYQTVAEVSLPIATVNLATTNFTVPVATSTINLEDNLIGFQGDFTFDSNVITFQNPAVSKAGLTGGSGNWTVTGSILPGTGPLRTLRVTGSSGDSIPLLGAGTLFNLNMTRVGPRVGQSTALTWDPSLHRFLFIDTNLAAHAPQSAPPGSISIH
jgi:hypothetical protein